MKSHFFVLWTLLTFRYIISLSSEKQTKCILIFNENMTDLVFLPLIGFRVFQRITCKTYILPNLTNYMKSSVIFHPTPQNHHMIHVIISANKVIWRCIFADSVFWKEQIYKCLIFKHVYIWEDKDCYISITKLLIRRGRWCLLLVMKFNVVLISTVHRNMPVLRPQLLITVVWTYGVQ
jgi:hypothetical protein